MVNSPLVVTTTARKVSGAMIFRMVVSGRDWEKRGRGERERRRRENKTIRREDGRTVRREDGRTGGL